MPSSLFASQDSAYTGSSEEPSAWWDRLGIGLSVLCLLHCIGLPVLLTGLTAWPASEALHFWMAVLLFPVVVVAGLPGYRAHGKKIVLWLFGTGLVLVLGALFLLPVVGELGETLITAVGSLCLIAGHVINWRAHRH